MTLPSTIPHPMPSVVRGTALPRWHNVDGAAATAPGDLPAEGAKASKGMNEIELIEMQLQQDFGDKDALAEFRAAYLSSEQKYKADLLLRGASDRCFRI